MREQPISWRKAGWGLFVTLAILAAALARPPAGDEDGRELAPEEQRKHLKAKEPALRRAAAKALGISGRADFVPDLRPLLKDEDAEVRLHAALALAKIGPMAEAASAELIALTKDPHGPTRAAAYAALGCLRLPSATTLPVYRAGLADGQVLVLQSALIASGGLGVEAKPLLPRYLELLRHADRDVRLAACFALGRLGADAKAAQTELKALLNDADVELKLEAATALWTLTLDAVYLKELEQVTRTREPRLRELAHDRLSQALRRWVDKNLPEALARLRVNEGTATLRRILLEVLAELPPEQLQIALPDIVERLDDGLLREAATKVILRVGPAAVPVLAKKLKSEQRTVRRESANILAQMEATAKPAIPALIEALNDPDSAVKTAAARALGQFGKDAASALPALRELTNEKDRPLAFQAKAAVAAIEGKPPPKSTAPARRGPQPLPTTVVPPAGN